MPDNPFKSDAPPADSKSSLTKVRVAPPPTPDAAIPEQDRKTWPTGGTAPMPEEGTSGPGSTSKGMAYGQMRTAKLAARAAKAAGR